MTTKYRLPDSLGGHEVLGSTLSLVDGNQIVRVRVGDQDVEIALPEGLLVEVKPPLPPEPPDGSVVRVDNPGPLRVFERDDRGMRLGNGASIDDGRRWFAAGSSEAGGWADVCSHGTPVLLVPAEPALTAKDLARLAADRVEGKA